MSPGGGGGSAELKTTLDMIKKQAHRESMSQYHRDLAKWARNVDKRYAWVILGSLWITMAASLGPYRMYGIIFAKVTSMGVYTREEASWPVSMIFTVENIIGPFVSVVAYHISFRKSMLVGSILLTLANGLTYFSDSLIIDVILIGFLQGVGYSFIFMPFMDVINNYFIKYRNLALGFALCGGTMSVFGFSPLFQWVLREYEWRTSYLVLAMICSSSLLMVPLLRANPRPKSPVAAAAIAAKESSNVADNEMRSTLSRMSRRALGYQNSMRRQSTILIATNKLDRTGSVISVNPFASSVGLERKISRVIADGAQIQPYHPQPRGPEKGNSLHKKAISRQHSTVDQQHQVATTTNNDHYETMSLGEVVEQEDDGEFKAAIIWNILRTPGFHLIWYLELLYYWIFSIYCLVLVDYGLERGCTRDEADSLLGFQSIGEIIGRIFLTVLVDLHYLSNKNVVILVLLILTGLLVGVTQVQGYILMAIITSMVSAFSSLLYILINALLVDFLGEQQVTIGYGMASCVMGVLIIFRPQAVGLFKDHLGSYDLLMATLGACSVIGAVLTIIEPLITRAVKGKASQERTTNDTNNNEQQA